MANKGEGNRAAIEDSLVTPGSESEGTEKLTREQCRKKIGSEHANEAKGLPEDPKGLEALKEWADAWGAYALQCKLENLTVPADIDKASPKLKEMNGVLEEKGDALSALLSRPTFFSGLVTWQRSEGEDGYLQLSL